MKYYLALDQGTTSSRAIVYSETFEALAVGQKSFPQHFPKSDWVEHDLSEIWDSMESSVKMALAEMSQKNPGFSPQQIRAIGITNQRETFGLWTKADSEPVMRAIVWQCRRSAELCSKLKRQTVARQVASEAGLVLDPYFSATKLMWVFKQRPDLHARAKKGELAFGTIDTFLIWKLSQGQSHVTDASNASRTLLMNLKTASWSPKALRLFGVPQSVLPTILDSNAEFGVTRGLSFLPDGIPITGVLGDQQSALFGQQCLNPGLCKVTYGTGAFFLMNVGSKPKPSKHGLRTVAWRLNGRSTYAVEGAVFIAGAAVQWIRDGLKMISQSKEIETVAKEVPDSDGVFFVPALTGLGTPLWVPGARGLLGGLSRRSSRGHIARAVLEGIAHSVCDLIEALSVSSGTKPKGVRVDGGASLNDTLLAAQSRFLGIPLERPKDVETTARGAAMMAALGRGETTLEDLSKLESRYFRVEPRGRPTERKTLRTRWKKQLKACADLAVEADH